MSKYILSLDQGTTSSRAIVVDHSGEIVAIAQKEFKQYFPQSGWVEHDPVEIWSSQKSVVTEATAKLGIDISDIAAIGITNQRETTVLWDRKTGKPVHNAIVWQDRRTSEFCDELRDRGHAELIQSKTGLVIDSYFSGTKLKWILDNVKGARERAEAGELAFGTVDSWLIWKLTKGKLHITDVSNASRTMLYNIHTLQWDDELLELLDIPNSLLPVVKSSSEVYGDSSFGIPIAGIAGDQQASLFGQMALDPGMVKNTYGTGCFLMANTGEKPVASKNNLLTTIAWQIGGKTIYALEGSIFIAGAVVQWMRDEMDFIRTSEDIEKLAKSVPDNGGVFMVPAFAGLGAPHWNQYARGIIAGISRGTKKGHIARAALEAICYQSKDVMEAMQGDAEIPIKEVRVDGGAAVNDALMQFQADILDINVVRPQMHETTALGAAYLAGLAVNFWTLNELKSQWQEDKVFKPNMDVSERKAKYSRWLKAVELSKDWL
ncbi:glycerol kinase GlpK [Cryomorphaceae bacterium 1068]|nr:glycerol kinase GlpK [Cryomorphaceae bacterium 1068]